jgi:hypothetical protein
VEGRGWRVETGVRGSEVPPVPDNVRSTLDPPPSTLVIDAL